MFMGTCILGACFRFYSELPLAEITYRVAFPLWLSCKHWSNKHVECHVCEPSKFLINLSLRDLPTVGDQRFFYSFGKFFMKRTGTPMRNAKRNAADDSWKYSGKQP